MSRRGYLRKRPNERVHQSKYSDVTPEVEKIWKSPDLESSDNSCCDDYFKIDKNSKQDNILVYSVTLESRITSLRYRPVKDKYADKYRLNLRNASKPAFGDSIDDFFDLSLVGHQERNELRAIKILMGSFVEKLNGKSS